MDEMSFIKNIKPGRFFKDSGRVLSRVTLLVIHQDWDQECRLEQR